jgi:hypothetical protein
LNNFDEIAARIFRRKQTKQSFRGSRIDASLLLIKAVCGG